MEFVDKIYEFIMYIIKTIKGLVASLKGEEEETTTIVPDTDGEGDTTNL